MSTICKVTVKRQLTNVKNKKSSVQIQWLNDKRLFMQVSTILREFIGMTTISQVTILSLITHVSMKSVFMMNKPKSDRLQSSGFATEELHKVFLHKAVLSICQFFSDTKYALYFIDSRLFVSTYLLLPFTMCNKTNAELHAFSCT